MKQFYFSFIVLMTFTAAHGQRPSEPVWSSADNTFTFTKLSEQLPTSKTVNLKYKDSRIILQNADNVTLIKITIDIPDIFFLKDGNVRSYDLKKDLDGNITFALIVTGADKMASVSLFYGDGSESPNSALVICTDKYTAKSAKRRSFILAELK